MDTTHPDEPIALQLPQHYLERMAGALIDYCVRRWRLPVDWSAPLSELLAHPVTEEALEAIDGFFTDDAGASGSLLTHLRACHADCERRLGGCDLGMLVAEFLWLMCLSRYRPEADGVADEDAPVLISEHLAAFFASLDARFCAGFVFCETGGEPWLEAATLLDALARTPRRDQVAIQLTPDRVAPAASFTSANWGDLPDYFAYAVRCAGQQGFTLSLTVATGFSADDAPDGYARVAHCRLESSGILDVAEPPEAPWSSAGRLHCVDMLDLVKALGLFAGGRTTGAAEADVVEVNFT